MGDESRDKHVELSVVVPLMNEQENIAALHGEITAALSGKFDYEVIYVDDGSTDGSFAELKKLHASDGRVTVIRFRRNFGQTAAMSAGFDAARGLLVTALDADRQNDPADIARMVEKVREGYDIVSGWRKDRKDKGLTRRLPSVLANKLIRRITGVSIHDFGCTLKVYRREVLAETRLYGEMHRFIPAIAAWHGATIAEMVVNHRPRTAGTSKYGLARTAKVVLDLITVRFLGSYRTKPIYVFGGIGMGAAGLALACGLVVVLQKILEGFAMNRNPLLTLTGVLIITSVQFILMGLLAEILVRTYHESQHRPIYTVRERLAGTDAGEQDEQCHAKGKAAGSEAAGR
jgi:glycosyltransferase involved in cell wall biosynthesis